MKNSVTVMIQILKLKMTQLVRDLISINWMIWYKIWGYQKKISALLASKLNKKNLFEKEAKVSYFWFKESGLLQYFWSDSRFVDCHNIQDLLEELEIPIYNSTEWWLFINSLMYTPSQNRKNYLHTIWLSLTISFEWTK